MSKKKNIIADTNVWYDLANGNTDILNAIKSKGELCVTPLNMLEIASKVNKDNFNLRRKAATAIVQYADRYLMSNESYLVRYWGYNHNDPVNWKDAALTLSKAKCYDDLQNGYYDPEINMMRKHDTLSIKNWRDFQYNDFKNGVIKAVESIHPDYMKRTRSNNLRKLTDKKLIKMFDYKELKKSSIVITYERAKILLNEEKIKHPKKPSKNMITNTIPKLKIYADVYAVYLKYLATTPAAPDMNDLGDNEQFMYLQNKNWILATSDKRWVNIANEVCPNNLLNLIPFKQNKV